jgi:hypothetical protein
MAILRRWKQTALHNQVLVLTGVFVAIGTSVYTLAAVGQYFLVKQTSEAQQKLIEQTAKEQYRLMERTAKETGDQTERIITHASGIANATKSSLEQSKRALDTSIEMSRRDQRAWIGLTELNAKWRDAANKPVYVKEGETYTVEVVIVNSGRTPALKVSIATEIVGRAAEENFVPPSYKNVKRQSLGVLQPQGKFTIPLTSNGALNASAIESLRNGSQILYLYGEIQYGDVFGISHRTTYCSTLAPTFDLFRVYSFYNEAN